MRTILLYGVFICSILSYTVLFAADKYVQTIPAGATLQGDGWYHLNGDRYQVARSNTISNTSVSTSSDSSEGNILGVDDDDLRTGNVDMNTIPQVLVTIINILLGVAGTIAVVSLIYHAVQMQINSGITGDSSGVDKAKKGMFGSVIGFVIAILAWFIVIRFIEILSGLS